MKSFSFAPSTARTHKRIILRHPRKRVVYCASLLLAVITCVVVAVTATNTVEVDTKTGAIRRSTQWAGVTMSSSVFESPFVVASIPATREWRTVQVTTLFDRSSDHYRFHNAEYDITVLSRLDDLFVLTKDEREAIMAEAFKLLETERPEDLHRYVNDLVHDERLENRLR